MNLEKLEKTESSFSAFYFTLKHRCATQGSEVEKTTFVDKIK
jgi:hypothetical protein